MLVQRTDERGRCGSVVIYEVQLVEHEQVGAVDLFTRFVRLGELRPPGQNEGPIRRVRQRSLLPSQSAGSDTMEDFQGEEKRTDNEREEHKVKIRESKGQSSFSQVQVADDGSRSAIEAKEIYKAERRAAEDTMQRQEVPAGYREYLRRYFDGMQPDEREKK